MNDKNLYLTTNDSIQLESGTYRTDTVSHSGKYSAFFNKWISYNMTYRFKNLRYGDLIEMSGWRKVETGELVISGSGKGCKDFFYSNKNVQYYDEKGWGYINLTMTMGIKCDSTDVIFFVWNPDSTKRAYFDDVRLSIKRYKGNYLDSLYLVK